MGITIRKYGQYLIVGSVVIIAFLLFVIFNDFEFDYAEKYIKAHNCEYFIIITDITSQNENTIYRCEGDEYFIRDGNHTSKTIEEVIGENND
jgi:hypothetical protein